MISISQAIKALDDSSQFVVTDNPSNESEYKSNVKYISGADENGFAIYSETQPFTWSQVSAKQTELQADYDAKEYQRKRASEYPSVIDQLDDIYHNGIDGWKTTIKAVKDKYPK